MIDSGNKIFGKPVHVLESGETFKTALPVVRFDQEKFEFVVTRRHYYCLLRFLEAKYGRLKPKGK